ncbi:MAG TPA: MFS transporter [Candidatus Limnocylindria bacterium]|nr:MFS transporter [Candidatus Limnocylindria bacterium]
MERHRHLVPRDVSSFVLRSPRGSYLLMLAVAASITTAKGTVEIIYPPYLAGYGYPLSIIGFLTSLIAVLQLVSRVPAGVAYRSHRAKRQYALALVAFGVSTIGFAFANGQGLVVAGLSALQGFAFGTLGTLGLALAIDVTGKRSVGASMAWYTAAVSTGYALGSLIGGTFAERIGMPATLGLVGVMPFIAAVAVMALPPLEGGAHVFDRGSGLRGLLASGARLDSRVWLAVVIVLYLNLVQDSQDTFFPVFAPGVGISLALVGLLRAIKSGAAIFIRFGIAVLLRSMDYRRVTLVAVIASALAAIAIPFSSSLFALFPIFVIMGLTRGMLRATSAATIAELRQEGRDVGLASGVYNAGLDIGSIIGPSVGGAIATAFGIGPMFQIVAGGSLAAFLIVALATPATRQAAGLAKRHTIGPRPIAEGGHSG